MRKLVVAMGGSSGSIYAKILLDRLLHLSDQWEEVGVVLSDNARLNWELELDETMIPDRYPFTFYSKRDFFAPFASGSAQYGCMIVCPCSMGLMARIATGVSTDLTTRAADVILKERRQLILVPRDTPYNLIHIENMRTLTLAGATVVPASPSFYSKPQTVEDVAATVVDRVLDLAGFSIQTYRWGKEKPPAGQ